MEVVAWLGFCVAVGYYANKRNRSPILWGLLAFFFSPLLTAIVLVLLKDKKVDNDISEIKMDHQQLRDRVATNEKITEMNFQNINNQIGQNLEQEKLTNIKSNMASLESNEYKTCPYCKEQIKKEAIKCRYCHQGIRDVKTELCPFCKGDVLSIDNICPHCDSEIKRKAKEIEKSNLVTDYAN